MSSQLQSFEHLLKLFEVVPTPTRSRTFMEIAGYPHYENVCSNILAFFLDASGEHGMGTLMLESLLDLAPAQEQSIDLEGFIIEREYRTPNGQRIDLVLQGNSHVIAIENKVYHWLANDLAHYAETIASLAERPKRHAINFVLSPSKIDEPGHGFESITYREIWERVKSRIGGHLSTADPKWLTILLDFIETSDRFIPSEKMELTESDHFFIKHEKTINALLEERNQFSQKLHTQASRLQTSLEQNLEGRVVSVWIYQKTSVVMEYDLCGHRVGIDQTIDPEGWFMGIMGRTPEAKTFLNQLLSNWPTEIMIRNTNEHVSFRKWPLETEIDTLSQEAEKTFDELTQYAKAMAARTDEIVNQS